MSRTIALSPQQQRFVDAYMEHRKANLAAIQAGFGATYGTVLMSKQEVRSEIARRLARCEEDSKISVARVAKELGHVALLDPADLFDDDGNLLPIRRMKPHVRRAISSIEVEHHKGRDGEPVATTKIKFWSKIDALDKLGKHLGMFIERHLIEGRLIQYVIQSPAPAATAADWAKTVHAEIVKEKK